MRRNQYGRRQNEKSDGNEMLLFLMYLLLKMLSTIVKTNTRYIKTKKKMRGENK